LTHRPIALLKRAAAFAALALTLAAPQAQSLPPEVLTALTRANVPVDSVAVLVAQAGTDGPGAPPTSVPRLSHRAGSAMNPASVMKLVSTYAALELLGPAYTWRTPVFTDGPVRDGTLAGNLYIKGQGDPKLVLERLWLLLRRVQGLGIHTIAGDIVLDRGAFEVPDVDPASFDGEPLRPYNATPDALLLNYKALVMTFTPVRGANFAQVQFDPPMAGVQMQATVPLSAGDCSDYRAALKADFTDPTRIRFGGSYSTSCGEKVWPVAYADPKSYASRAVQGMWLSMGGKLTGNTRMGSVPPDVLAAKPAFEVVSPPLAEIIRDINKYSNNVMAQQVFLTLGQSGPGAASGARFDSARLELLRWWKDRFGADDAPVLDNGSGLSRQERISAQSLNRLLQTAYASPLMPELMASLPITGVDGTMRRAKARANGSAHLKTGSLNGVVSVAGYVHANSGKRYVLVLIINHANANAARAAVDALIDWTAKDR
jgi:D-alanyl-D-alanine carboxypeptidase/D-alanyl-D-alanine-endopeptidase (penicillin-binding protein 4)